MNETFDPTKDLIPDTITPPKSDVSSTFDPTASTTPEEGDGLLMKGAKGIGNLGLGILKGAGDTLMSVKRNVQKPIVEYNKLQVQKTLNEARETIVAQNDKLLTIYKSLPKDDPRRAKYSKMMKDNNNQLFTLGEEEDAIMREIDDVSTGSGGDQSTITGKVQGFLNKSDKALTPEGKAQQVGYAGEKVAEFFVPAGAVAKADKAIAGVKVIPGVTRAANIGNATIRTGLKMGTEALASGGVSLAQSSYQGRLDTEEGRANALDEAKNIGLIAGGTKGIFAGAGEFFGKPQAQKLYQSIYKQTPKEGESIFDSVRRAVPKTSDEQVKLGKELGLSGKDLKALAEGSSEAKDKLYKVVSDAIEQGGDKIVGGQSLSQWAIDQKVTGSLKKQSLKVMRLLDDAEQNVQSTAGKSTVRVPIDKNLDDFAKKLSENYADFGKGEFAKSIDDIMSRADDNGTLSLKDTIALRRILDGLRSKASYKGLNVGDNLQYWSDSLRKVINNSDGLGDVNKDYAFALQARDALIKKAQQDGNKQVLGALEAYVAGEPLASAGNPGGFIAVAAKRTVNSPTFQTNAGQFFNKLGESTKKGIMTRSVIAKEGEGMTKKKPDFIVSP